MVHGNNQRFLWRSAANLALKPLLLLARPPCIKSPVNIRVKPNDGCKRCVKRPVNVGLRHCGAVGTIIMAYGITKVSHKAEERWLSVYGIAGTRRSITVVVARDS